MSRGENSTHPPKLKILLKILFLCLDNSSSLDGIEIEAIAAELGLDRDLVSDQWILDFLLYEEGIKPPKLFDNLKSASYFWEHELGAPADVLDIIRNGYKIPFLKTPPKYEKRNNQSAFENSEFVSKALNELLEANLIEIVDEKPWIISPLSVAKSGDKLRLILDLSVTNSYVKAESFSLEDQNLFYDFEGLSLLNTCWYSITHYLQAWKQ